MIYTDYVEFQGALGDAGLHFTAQCPECGEHIHVAESGWWDTECKCGYTWRLEVNIIGEKRE